jgi:hypothetical protein
MIYYKRKETFASSAGAFLQLYAKGPQDIYLTGNESLNHYWYQYNPYYRPVPYNRTLYP